ncbi:hypothetical protein THRCLA_05997 [Thraustotheca clavata]|uniref:RanBD1 domain-containing protein n=1 Tax=Thraustotheca clavata TaxID=74557 RepID=A0A1V9ZQR0_9STRA|nr:hypothetical protein THRCLA_05997 [Thraustotheca clavata]
MSSPSHKATVVSPVAKRQRLEGDEDVHAEHEEIVKSPKATMKEPTSPKRKSPTKETSSPTKVTETKTTAPTWGFTSFANTNGFGAAAKLSTTTGFGSSTSSGFGAFANNSGFGAFTSNTSSTTSGGFGEVKASGFGTTFGALAKTTLESESTSKWTEESTGNDEFLSTEATVADAPVKVPVVELPKDYHHVTGEENEEVILLLQVKLYKFTDGKYVECGQGPLKILRPVDCGEKKDRIVIRRATSDFKAGTHLLLNSLLSAIVKVTLKPKNLIVHIAIDPKTVSTFCIRTATVEEGDSLYSHLNK